MEIQLGIENKGLTFRLCSQVKMKLKFTVCMKAITDMTCGNGENWKINWSKFWSRKAGRRILNIIEDYQNRKEKNKGSKQNAL